MTELPPIVMVCASCGQVRFSFAHIDRTFCDKCPDGGWLEKPPPEALAAVEAAYTLGGYTAATQIALTPAKRDRCDPDTHCAVCQVPLIPEHAHMRCPKCGRRDSCCF